MGGQIGIVTLNGWVGGVNKDSDPFQVNPNELSDCINVDILPRGALAKRKGVSTHLTVDVVPATKAIWYRKFRVLGGDTYDVALLENGNLAYGIGNINTIRNVQFTWERAQDNATYQIPAALLNGEMFVTSLRSGAPIRFDGTSVTSMGSNTFAQDETDLNDKIDAGDDLPQTMPQARVLLSAYGRLFAMNVIDNDSVHRRNRMYYSLYESDPAADPLVWPALQYENVGGDDGEEISSATLFGADTIVIFKTHSIYLLTGRTRDSFVLQKAHQEIGTVAGDTVVTTASHVLFFDPSNGVYAFDGAFPIAIDEQIKNYLLDGVTDEYAYRSQGVVHNNRYYLSVPWGGDSYPSRTFVYDMTLNAWTIYDYGFVSAWSDDDKELYATQVLGSDIYKLNSGYSDDGADIDFNIEFTYLVPEEISSKVRIRRADFVFADTGAFDVHVDMYSDYGVSTDVEKILSLSGGGFILGTSLLGSVGLGRATTQIHKKSDGWGTYHNSFKFILSNDNADEPIQLNMLQLHLSQRKHNRGTI